jgi:hypothetical protein
VEQLHSEPESTAAAEQQATTRGHRFLERDGCNANDPATPRTKKTGSYSQARVVTTSSVGTELNTEETSMNLTELLNPWAALRRAKLEVDTLRREQTLLLEELRKAQKALTPLEAHNKHKRTPKK